MATKKTNKGLQAIADRKEKAAKANKKALAKKAPAKETSAKKKETKKALEAPDRKILNGLEYEKNILSRYNVSKHILEAHTSKQN